MNASLRPALWVCVIALAFTCAAAGCSGGGHALLPNSPGPVAPAAPQPQASNASTVTAAMRVVIPKAGQARSHYVSPNTKAFVVVVQPVSASSPWPSPMPAQTFDVAVPPCTAVAGGLACTFKIQVMAGSDEFTFEAFDTTAATGQPLALLKTGVTKVDGEPLAFTMDGVVHSVALGVSRPDVRFAKPTQVLQIGWPGAFGVTVMPRDASGAVIASSAFASPIRIAVVPANAGVTLRLHPQCPNEPGPFKGTSIVLACASDLTHVTGSYDGTVVYHPADGTPVDTVAIVARPNPEVSPPPPAFVAFASGVQALPVTNSNQNFGSQLQAAGDGKIYVAVPSVVGTVIDSFDPANPTVVQAMSLNTIVNSFLVDASGQIWTASQGEIQCFTGIGATPQTVTIPENVLELTQSGSQIWFETQDNSTGPASLTGGVGYLSPAPHCGGLPASTQRIAQLGSQKFNPTGIAPAGTVNGHPAVWASGNLSAFPNFDAQVFLATQQSSGVMAAAYDAGTAYGTEGIASDGNGTTYLSLLPNDATSGLPSEVASFAGTGSPAPSPVFSAQPNSVFYTVKTSSAAGSWLGVVDGGYGPHNGIDLVDLGSPGTPTFLPLDGSVCFGFAFDRFGGAWATCNNQSGVATIYHPVYTPLWGLLPHEFLVGTLPGGFPNHNAFGIIERPGSDSSPFALAGNTQPSYYAPEAAWPGFSHDIPVTNVMCCATTSIKVKDKNGNALSAPVEQFSVQYLRKKKSPAMR